MMELPVLKWISENKILTTVVTACILNYVVELGQAKVIVRAQQTTPEGTILTVEKWP